MSVIVRCHRHADFARTVDEPGVEGFLHQVVMPRLDRGEERVAAGRTWKERPNTVKEKPENPRSIIPGAHLRYVNGRHRFPPPSESVAVLQELVGDENAEVGHLGVGIVKEGLQGPRSHQAEQVRSTKRRALELDRCRGCAGAEFPSTSQERLGPAAILVRQAFHFLRVGEFDEIEAFRFSGVERFLGSDHVEDMLRFEDPHPVFIGQEIPTPRFGFRRHEFVGGFSLLEDRKFLAENTQC